MRIHFSLLASLFILVGCASVPEEPKSALDGVKSITVIAPREPWAYSVMRFVNLGLLELEVSTGDSKGKEILLTEMLKRKSFNFTSELTANIVDRLTQAGYQITLQDSPWVQVGEGYRLNFAGIQSKTDATLVLAPTVMGMTSPGGTPAYVPTITAVMTLLPKGNGEPLYQGFFATGWKPAGKMWQFVPAKQSFDVFDDVIDKPDAAIASLKQAGLDISNLAIDQLLVATRP